MALNAALHRSAPDGTPALIAVDQEGGLVQRVRAPATQWPPMRAHDGLAAPDDTALAEQVGRAMGDELRALGFDIDFAPILDVHTNPANPIIGDRAFGVLPETAARRALAFARGLDAAGSWRAASTSPGMATPRPIATWSCRGSITTGIGSSAWSSCRSSAPRPPASRC
ncbi:MAG: glycoside hydrolase family 3 protein [Myxococcales bacterium]|nr:glycoside hydrolase family 3 protein [Myxococcales bacterium]